MIEGYLDAIAEMGFATHPGTYGDGFIYVTAVK